MERQAHGAEEAPTAVLAEHALTDGAETSRADPSAVRWKDESEAEMALRRFLRDFPV